MATYTSAVQPTVHAERALCMLCMLCMRCLRTFVVRRVVSASVRSSLGPKPACRICLLHLTIVPRPAAKRLPSPALPSRSGHVHVLQASTGRNTRMAFPFRVRAAAAVLCRHKPDRVACASHGWECSSWRRQLALQHARPAWHACQATQSQVGAAVAHALCAWLCSPPAGLWAHHGAAAAHQAGRSKGAGPAGAKIEE